LNRIFAAGVETFRQNSVDIFMDCPGRERAGWLCDSFFTARVEPDLTGGSAVEHDFLENFALPANFDPLPPGMLPMVWPADLFDGGRFIPNWALFFVLQLEEFLDRSGDGDLVERLRNRVMALFDYFQRFVNQDGLLERLDSWVFVEWSKANDLVQDVSHPTNMLFAAALKAAARLYSRPDLATRAEAMHAALRRTAFADGWCVDNALRRDGALTLSGESSEVCQYFAFFFGTATPASHPELWHRVLDELGPARRVTGAHPRIHPANAFVGNYLRMDLLSRAGRRTQLMHELVQLFLTMADTTGTLWEQDHSATVTNCNQGFASHTAHVLIRDIAGLARIDRVHRTVTVNIDPELPLDWCEVELPCGEDRLRLRWWKEGAVLRHDLDLPAGWRLEAEVGSGQA
jgi:alpha-L-rhamnosidase